VLTFVTCRYIKLFGYNFTKNDHTTFVKTLFELVTLPDMDYGLVQKFALCLIVLLKLVKIYGYIC
jgi:hypothetical protein